MHEKHIHDLDYLLKSDGDGHLVGRVLQLPGIIVQGITEPEIERKIQRTTVGYLHAFEDDHERIMHDKDSKLTDSGHGIILGTKQFKVTC
jgi:predicted RNase H-like HicB family nuclease